jgi:hypothetical protein
MPRRPVQFFDPTAVKHAIVPTSCPAAPASPGSMSAGPNRVMRAY